MAESREAAFRSSFRRSFVEARASGVRVGKKRRSEPVGLRGDRKGESKGASTAEAELAAIAAAEAEAERAALAEAAAEAEALYGTISHPTPSTCPPGYEFAAPMTDACVPIQ